MVDGGGKPDDQLGIDIPFHKAVDEGFFQMCQSFRDEIYHK